MVQLEEQPLLVVHLAVLLVRVHPRLPPRRRRGRVRSAVGQGPCRVAIERREPLCHRAQHHATGLEVRCGRADVAVAAQVVVGESRRVRVQTHLLVVAAEPLAQGKGRDEEAVPGPRR